MLQKFKCSIFHIKKKKGGGITYFYTKDRGHSLLVASLVEHEHPGFLSLSPSLCGWRWGTASHC